MMESKQIDEGWLDSPKQMGYRFRDEIKSPNDPSTCGKIKADDPSRFKNR